MGALMFDEDGVVRPAFIDIDGTLTTEPHKRWGPPRMDVIDAVKKLIASGVPVILWSGGGGRYAAEFAKKYGMDVKVCFSKPCMIVDDNPHIRPQSRMPFLGPDAFLAYISEKGL